MSTSDNKTVSLTLKSDRPKGDNRSFRRAGIEVPGVFTRMEVPAEAVKALKAEGMVIVADDMKSAELVNAINKLDDVVQIKALMECSTSKPVQKAGMERIELFGGDTSEPEEEESGKDAPLSKDDILGKIAEASTVEEVKALDTIILEFKGSQDYLKVISDAQAARTKELGG
jgi:hypothetical protein